MSVEKDISEIKTDLKEIRTSLESFKLGVSVDIALLKQKTKSNAAKWGLLSGAIVSILIGVAKKYIL